MNEQEKILHNKIALELLRTEDSSNTSSGGTLDTTPEAFDRFDFFNHGVDCLRLVKELGKSCIVILSCVNNDWKLIGWRAHDYRNHQESKMYETYEEAVAAGLALWADLNITPMAKKIRDLTQDIKNDKTLVLTLLKKHNLYTPNYMKLRGDVTSREQKT